MNTPEESIWKVFFKVKDCNSCAQNFYKINLLIQFKFIYYLPLHHYSIIPILLSFDLESRVHKKFELLLFPTSHYSKLKCNLYKSMTDI